MMSYEACKYVEGVKALKDISIKKIMSDMDINTFEPEAIEFLKLLSKAVDASNAMVLKQAELLDKMETEMEEVLRIVKEKTN